MADDSDMTDRVVGSPPISKDWEMATFKMVGMGKRMAKKTYRRNFVGFLKKGLCHTEQNGRVVDLP